MGPIPACTDPSTPPPERASRAALRGDSTVPARRGTVGKAGHRPACGSIPQVIRVATLGLCVLATAAFAGPPDDETASERRLGMTKAVVCESIKGYRDYVELDPPSRTRDEKLLIYFEPTGYDVEKSGTAYQAHLTQDVKLRKRGEKKVLWQKNDILKYQPKSKSPPAYIYLSNTIALKTYEPGEYDLELILHDRIGEGDPITQVVKFTIAPSPEPRETPTGESEAKEKASDSPRS